MPRPVFIPIDPRGLAEWDGNNGRSHRQGQGGGQDFDEDYEPNVGPLRQQRRTPVLVNGSIMPTSYIEALMQSTPGVEQLGSSEELVELAHAIEYEMQTLLTDRERFVVEAIVFEGLSLRDVAARWGNAWSKTQVARIRDAAYGKLGKSERLRSLAGLAGSRSQCGPDTCGYDQAEHEPAASAIVGE